MYPSAYMYSSLKFSIASRLGLCSQQILIAEGEAPHPNVGHGAARCWLCPWLCLGIRRRYLPRRPLRRQNLGPECHGRSINGRWRSWGATERIVTFEVDREQMPKPPQGWGVTNIQLPDRRAMSSPTRANGQRTPPRGSPSVRSPIAPPTIEGLEQAR